MIGLKGITPWLHALSSQYNKYVGSAKDSFLLKCDTRPKHEKAMFYFGSGTHAMWRKKFIHFLLYAYHLLTGCYHSLKRKMIRILVNEDFKDSKTWPPIVIYRWQGSIRNSIVMWQSLLPMVDKPRVCSSNRVVIQLSDWLRFPRYRSFLAGPGFSDVLYFKSFLREIEKHVFVSDPAKWVCAATACFDFNQVFEVLRLILKWRFTLCLIESS